MTGMLFSQMEPREGWEEDFHRWYEHVPLLMQVPGWLRVRRYTTRPGSVGALGLTSRSTSCGIVA
jgi:hypothetical protein